MGCEALRVAHGMLYALVGPRAWARRGYPPLQGGLKLTRPQQNACSAFLALCAEVEPPAS